MAPTLYKNNASPPCRGVLLTASAIECELEFQEVDMATGQHIEEEFLEKNPQHSIPTLEDEDVILIDSHAIMIYLVNKYGGEDHAGLYPDDPETRGLVNHRLFYNCGTLQSLLREIARPFFFEGKTTVDEAGVDKTIEAYSILEKFLGDREWMVGDATTLADLAIIPSVSSLNVFVPIDEEACPNLMAWLARCEELPYYDSNREGNEEFKALYDKIMSDGNEAEAEIEAADEEAAE